MNNEKLKIMKSDKSPGHTRGGIECLGGVRIPLNLSHLSWDLCIDQVNEGILSEICVKKGLTLSMKHVRQHMIQ